MLHLVFALRFPVCALAASPEEPETRNWKLGSYTAASTASCAAAASGFPLGSGFSFGGVMPSFL